jgi:ketosteroid isomerase-like protein
MSGTAIEAVKAADDARWQGLVTQNHDLVASLLHDDLMYTHSNALFESKSELVGNLRSGAFHYKSVKRGEPKCAVHGGAVMMTNTAHIEAAYKGTPMTVRMRFSSVWIQGPGGAWQMVLWHSVALPG